ncbi:DUF3575 domain-containing protein [Sphingobacterium endophyticum]|uniref:DUF3575 domain-containing protein n=1 Tax=Sphingobacterium endophyticum TaxID=2546448 RepID=UPI0012E209F5|nr:DUF3575 domain-containing protein [Sphingobacterium endophyticum]
MYTLSSISMKLWLVTIALLLFGGYTKAQQNTVKFNLLPLVSKTFSFEYERRIKDRISINTSLGFRGKSSLPFKSTFQDIADDDEFFEDATLSHFTLSPELRFYTSKNYKDENRGFYFGPFIKYAKYNFGTNFEYTVENSAPETIPLDGSVGTWSAGIAIGSQFKLTESLFLDLRILGPHFGTSNIKMQGKKSLTAEEQEIVRQDLGDLDNDYFKIDKEINSEGVTLTSKGPWAGIRAGVSLGYRF